MKNKILLKAIICCLLVFALCVNASAAYTSSNSDYYSQQRREELFALKADSIGTDYKITVAQIKTVYDFAGNEYTVVECEPTGYFIFHNSSGVFTESSPTAISPYEGINHRLFYGGPMQYFQQRGSKFVHTITAAEVDVSSLNELSVGSSSLNNNLLAVSDTDIVNYIKNGNMGISPQLVNIENAFTHIPYYSVIYRLSTRTQMGYYSAGPSGCCGYIGLGIMLLYADYVWNDGYINDALYLDSTHAFTGSSFTQHLIAVGEELGYVVPTSYAHTIRPINERYLLSIGMNATHYQHSALPSDSTITGYIDNDLPVLLFGSLTDPSTESGNVLHAVVAYGYAGSGSSLQYKVHYGWTGYTDVVLNAATIINGSAYTFAP